MANFNKSVLTIKGNELLASAVSGEQIEFVRLETGNGIYDGVEDLSAVDSLKCKQQEFPFLRYERVSEGTVLLVALVSNENLSMGYHMTEIGVYGKLKGSGEEILCSITTSVTADFWPPFNGVAPERMFLRCHITISPDAMPCITVSDNMVLAEVAAEANRANAAEAALSRKISVLENPEFEEAAKRENIESGEKVPALFGKIKKWFADLKPIAFSGKYMDLSGAPTRLSEFEDDSSFASTVSPEFTGTPKAPTPAESDNSTRIATTAFVKAIVSALINGAPETLDTFGEIAEAFAENETVINALNEAIGKKLSKTEAAVSAEKWTNGRNVNGLIIDGTSNRANYGACSTAAATAAKTVSCAGFGLVMGAEITVRFTVTNTAANPTLNVNGTGAKPIYYHGAAITAGYLAANSTYIFRYNGTQYDLVGDVNTNTTYGLATNSTRGLVKIGYTENGKNYPVELSNEQMYVNVPWTDTNTWKANTADSEGYVAKGSGQANQVWKTDANGVPGWRADANTTYANFVKSGTGAKAGLVPAPSTTAGSTKYLREDGTWAIPPNTTYGNMSAATASAAGKAGLVPAPSAGKQNAYLRGDGTWAIPTNNLLATEPGTSLDAVQGKNLKAEVDALNSKLVDLLIVKSVQETISVLYLNQFSVDIPIPDGYKAIGLVSQAGDYRVNIFSSRISNNKIVFLASSRGSEEVSVTLLFNVLFQKI